MMAKKVKLELLARKVIKATRATKETLDPKAPVVFKENKVRLDPRVPRAQMEL